MNNGLLLLGSGRGGPGASWTPAVLSPLLWVEDGNPVDKGTGGRSLSQSDPTKMPSAGSLNGHGTWVFDGVDDYLTMASGYTGLPVGGSARSVFTVARLLGYGGFGYAWFNGSDYPMGLEFSGPFRTYAGNYYNADGTNLTLNQWYIFGQTLTGTTLRHYKGLTEETGSPITITASPGGIPTKYTLGSIEGASAFTHFEVAAQIILGSVPSDADRALLIARWKTRYGL